MSNFFEKLKKGMKLEEPIPEEANEEDKSSSPPFANARVSEEDKSSSPPFANARVSEEDKSSSPPFANARVSEEDKSPSLTSLAKASSLKEVVTKTKTVKKQSKSGKENKTPEFKTETLDEEPNKTLTVQALAVQTEIVETKPQEQKVKKRPFFSQEKEGQLTIDVYQTENDLVIQSAIAGVKPENLDISIEREIITIRGEREKQHRENGDYFVRECFWGPFSRQIILPVEVDPGRAKASFREGILTVRIPKIQREKKMKINISA